MSEFCGALGELLEEVGTSNEEYGEELLEGRHIHGENNDFYFEIKKNNKGYYMHISEGNTNFKKAINIPGKFWAKFRDIISEYVVQQRMNV